jgi:diadenosine tetraphosphate (Ap4A) HIT family hydrolase/5-methylcytosine-specific restriction endonuclease McrA
MSDDKQVAHERQHDQRDHPSNVFETLKDFLLNKMQMSHIYQPVMLKVLLEGNGSATARQIAEAILARDPTQLEYYEEVTKRMPGPVLTRRGLVRRDGDVYRLQLDFGQLSDAQRAELIQVCDEKLGAYEAQRGMDMWNYRRGDKKRISGRDWYGVLEEAHGRCVLCGVSKEEYPLVVDHIIPRSPKHKGRTVRENLQALCLRCNSSKGDRHTTDLRHWGEIYNLRDATCLFCNPNRSVLFEEDLAYVVRDAFPVTPLHSLVIPKRHVADFFEVAPAENLAVLRLLARTKNEIQAEDPTVVGFNIGVNNGAAAGQTVFHVHVHLIPRRAGDVDQPRGGVRAVITGKASY